MVGVFPPYFIARQEAVTDLRFGADRACRSGISAYRGRHRLGQEWRPSRRCQLHVRRFELHSLFGPIRS